jgi:AhpC/TSA family
VGNQRCALFMTTTTHAPELLVQTWFNTDRPLLLSGLRGRVIVLAAFQVLCPNSIAGGVPQAQRIFETFEPNDVAVIGLHATFEHHDAFNPAVLKAFIHEYRLKFPIALDQPNPASPIPHTMERYKMRGTPSLVLIDRHGFVRKHTFGTVDDLRIGAEIGALTQESDSAALARSSAA